MLERPKFMKCIGFDCWHDYNSNPKKIDILLSVDGEQYIAWKNIEFDLVNI